MYLLVFWVLCEFSLISSCFLGSSSELPVGCSNELLENASKFYSVLVSSNEVSLSSHGFSVSSCEFYLFLASSIEF